MDANFDRFDNSWFLVLSFLINCQLFSSSEDLRDFFNISIDL